MMLLSLILSSAVFAQCSPVESIWNPLLADKKVCHINLTILAFVDCCKWALLITLTAWMYADKQSNQYHSE